MFLRRILFFFLVFVSGIFNSFSQQPGTAGGYTHRHYGTGVYQMHPRNFYITQDNRELMYFGNAYGVIEFDGSSWRDLPLTHGNSGLSLRKAENDRVYVGSYNELGYLEPDATGSTVYHSLYEKIPASLREIETVFDIFSVGNSIIYFSAFGFYVLENDSFTVVPVASKDNLFQYACQVGKAVYVNQVGTGLCELRGKNVELIPGGGVFRYTILRDIIGLDADRLLVLEDNGLFVFGSGKRYTFNAETNRILSTSKCSHVLRLKNGSFLITTFDNGMYVLDAFGKIVEHIHQRNGLPSNTINYAYEDVRGGLWLALDNGISYLEINAPFTYTGSSSGVSGIGYSAALYEGKLYLGTSQGLFAGHPEDRTFRKVKGVHDAVWNLAVIDNTLLCCQKDHLYQVKGETATEIRCPLNDQGNWKIMALKNRPGYAIEGTYEGLLLYKYENGHWKFERKLKGFDESSRMFAQQEENVVWICQGNKGVYKVVIADDLSAIRSVENYSEKNGLPADFLNDIALVNGELVFGSGEGLYKLDKSGKVFVKDTVLNKFIGAGAFVSKLFQYDDQNLWLFGGNDLRLFKKKPNGQYEKEDVLFRKVTGQLVGSYEFLLPVNKSVVIGAQEGFIFYKDQPVKLSSDSFPVLIRKIEATYNNDSLLYAGNGAAKKNPWAYGLNGLRFTYSALFYENPERLKYQYALTSKGDNDIQWSAWTSNTQVEFSSLYEGDYVFHVRAKNIYEESSRSCTYSFTILAPWYRSTLAWVIYTALFLALVYILYEIIKKRFKRQREKLQEEKRKELMLQQQKHIAENLQNEKELITLRNEKLEAEMVLKNTELASLATTLAQKSEFLTHLKEKLEELQAGQDKSSTPAFKEIIKTIDHDLDFDDDWAKFQIHFDELHHNFLHRLREKFPKLKPSWLLLCAYIRMNKSNKEIASHLNISVAGVEKRKYRLKEKLELGEEEKLADYLISF